MKTIISTAIIASIFALSCNSSAKQEAQIREAKQQTLDSINQVQTAARIEQLRQDSIKNVERQQRATASSNNNNAAGSSSEPQTAEQKKKGMSNTTKGALIGTGAGVVTGAIIGAATSEDKAKGAVIGGVVGGAVGSGAGYGTGAAIDKKKKKE
jgi:hypothetical protein